MFSLRQLPPTVALKLNSNLRLVACRALASKVGHVIVNHVFLHRKLCITRVETITSEIRLDGPAGAGIYRATIAPFFRVFNRQTKA